MIDVIDLCKKVNKSFLFLYGTKMHFFINMKFDFYKMFKLSGSYKKVSIYLFYCKAIFAKVLDLKLFERKWQPNTNKYILLWICHHLYRQIVVCFWIDFEAQYNCQSKYFKLFSVNIIYVLMFSCVISL